MLMLMVAFCSDYTVRMLIKLGKQVNKHYYEQLVQSQFGRTGYIAVCAAMGIFAYGAMVAYLIGIGACASCGAPSCTRVSAPGVVPPLRVCGPAATRPAPSNHLLTARPARRAQATR